MYFEIELDFDESVLFRKETVIKRSYYAQYGRATTRIQRVLIYARPVGIGSKSTGL